MMTSYGKARPLKARLEKLQRDKDARITRRLSRVNCSPLGGPLQRTSGGKLRRPAGGP